MLKMLVFVVSFAAIFSGIFCVFLVLFLGVNRVLYALGLTAKWEANWRARAGECLILTAVSMLLILALVPRF